MVSIEWPDLRFPPVNQYVLISAYDFYTLSSKDARRDVNGVENINPKNYNNKRNKNEFDTESGNTTKII